MKQNIEPEKLQHLQTLYPIRSVYIVIGSICQDPDILRSRETDLKVDDFMTELHRLIFSVIHNIAYEDLSVTSISEIDIDNYLSELPHLYEKWEQFNGMEYVYECIQNTNIEQFEFNYQRLKKFSLLRKYYITGIDIRDVYNYETENIQEISQQMKKLDDMTLDDITHHVTNKFIDIREEFAPNTDENIEYDAGDGIFELIEQMGESPDYGYPFQNEFYNTIFRGKSTTRYMLRSADSGVGKTRTNLADLIFTCADAYYDIDRGEYVKNPHAVAGLVIFTETTKLEAQRLMLAIISGIDENIIKDGDYKNSPELYDRIMKAGHILENSRIYVSYQDDFSILDIKLTVEKYILRKNVSYVAFDYIQITPKTAQGVANEFGYTLREDQILHRLSTELKNIAVNYNVYISSGTQLNRNSKIAELRDSASLRGGSATADKVDMGVLLFRPTATDIKNLQHIIRSGYEEPNYSHWVYKNRIGQYDRVIIWTKMDLGNMREKVLFVTDRDYNLLDIPKTTINMMEDNNINITKEDMEMVEINDPDEQETQIENLDYGIPEF